MERIYIKTINNKTMCLKIFPQEIKKVLQHGNVTERSIAERFFFIVLVVSLLELEIIIHNNDVGPGVVSDVVTSVS